MKLKIYSDYPLNGFSFFLFSPLLIEENIILRTFFSD